MRSVLAAIVVFVLRAAFRDRELVCPACGSRDHTSVHIGGDGASLMRTCTRCGRRYFPAFERRYGRREKLIQWESPVGLCANYWAMRRGR